MTREQWSALPEWPAPDVGQNSLVCRLERYKGPVVSNEQVDLFRGTTGGDTFFFIRVPAVIAVPRSRTAALKVQKAINASPAEER